MKKKSEDKTELENKISRGNDAARTLNDELQDIKFVAGSDEAVEPGVQGHADRQPHAAGRGITFQQFKQSTILTTFGHANVVNELKAAEAGRFSVNGPARRPVYGGAVVGPVVQVNLGFRRSSLYRAGHRRLPTRFMAA